VFSASLFFVAYTTNYDGKPKEHFGLEAFLLGPIGLFAGHYSWIANPLLLFAWARRTDPNWGQSFVLAVVAAAFALSFLLPKTIAVGSAGEYSYAANIGYYLWLLSIALAAIAAALFKSPPSSVSAENAA
jgi:hypothetical protein